MKIQTLGLIIHLEAPVLDVPIAATREHCTRHNTAQHDEAQCEDIYRTVGMARSGSQGVRESGSQGGRVAGCRTCARRNMRVHTNDGGVIWVVEAQEHGVLQRQCAQVGLEES